MAASESKRDILQAYREICLEKGASLPVGPAHYRWFVDLTDDDMAEMVRLMLLDRATEIKRWLDAYPQMKSEQDIFDYVELMLDMIARGFAGIQKNGSLGCFAPVGPEPSEAELQEIDHKIRATRPLFRNLVFRILGVDLGETDDRRTEGLVS